MKTRLRRAAALVLTALMALVLLPATAERTEAAGGFPKKSDITLEGQKLSVHMPDGVSYDESTGTLTFDDYSAPTNAYNNSLIVGGSASRMTITFGGSSNVINASRCAINAPNCDITFTGSGSLSLATNVLHDSDNPETIYGILCKSLTMKGGTGIHISMMNTTMSSSPGGIKTANCIAVRATGDVTIGENSFIGSRTYCSQEHGGGKPDLGISAGGAITISSTRESQCDFVHYGYNEKRIALSSDSKVINISNTPRFSTLSGDLTNIDGFTPAGYIAYEEEDEHSWRASFILEPPVPRHYVSIAGANRFATAVEVAKTAFQYGPPNGEVVIVTGRKFPDALAANGYAGVAEAPILLSELTSLRKETRELLSDYWAGAVSKVTVIGNEFSGGFYSDLKALGFSEAAGNLQKIGGKNRYKTAEAVYEATVKLASSKGIPITAVAVATGQEPYDALSFSPWAYGWHIPILLVKNGVPTSDKTRQMIAEAPYVFLLGSEKVCSEKSLSAEQRAHFLYQRLAGSNRYKTSQEIARFFVEMAGGGTYNGIAFADGTEAHYPDALAAGMLQGQLDAPVILMVEGDKGVKHVLPWVMEKLSVKETEGNYFYFIGWAAEGKSNEFGSLAGWIEPG